MEAFDAAETSKTSVAVRLELLTVSSLFDCISSLSLDTFAELPPGRCQRISRVSDISSLIASKSSSVSEFFSVFVVDCVRWPLKNSK